MTFEQLQELKTPAVVMVALAFDKKDEDNLKQQMTECFTDMGFLKNGARVVGIEKIEGNILGDNGRTDVVISLDKFDVNPLARLMMPDIKWVEDFIVNYGGDYGFEPLDPDIEE